MSMITSSATVKIRSYNNLALHYELVATSVYRCRSKCADVYSDHYLRHIVAALMVFDIGRMMGKGARKRYDVNADGFASRLSSKLRRIAPHLDKLLEQTLVDVNLPESDKSIRLAYNELAAGGKNGLSEERKGNTEEKKERPQFHVGATKILHFMNPHLFLIMDSNAAAAFRKFHGVPYNASTQPGYVANRYIACLRHAKQDIQAFGVEAFKELEPGTPIARIYDKLCFATVTGWF